MSALSNLVAGLASDLDHMTSRLVSGQLSPAQWQRAVQGELADYHTAAYLSGAAERLSAPAGSALLNARNLSRAERADIARAVTDQAGYLNGFTASIERGDLSPAQIRARAASYAGGVKATYWEARAPGLPFYPGNGCECGTNCHCSWQQRDGEWWWTLGGSVEHCDDCRRRADGSPY
jgi:hypothetical protein